MTSQVEPDKINEIGQIVVIFALGLVVMIASAGLILDGGSSYAQSREEQRAADLAALAGANDYMLNSQSSAALSRASMVAQTNGYTNGTITSSCPVGSQTTSVVSSLDASTAQLTVTITAPHSNGFARIVGQSCWAVTVTATAQGGIPDTATGVGPMLFNVDAFGTNGQPLAQYGDPAHPFAFAHGQGQAGDAPAGPGNMSWTDWSFTANDNTAITAAIIAGTSVITKTLQFGEYIGQHNNGQHAALFGDVQLTLVGQDLPVAIVDGNGNYMGWATFHVVSADQGGKTVSGYFNSRFLNQRLSVGACTSGHCPRYFGSYILGLTN